MRKHTQIFTLLIIIISLFLAACNNADTIVCGNCSTKNSVDSQFCSNCGTAFFQNNTSAETDATHATLGTTDSTTSKEDNATVPPTSEPTQPSNSEQEKPSSSKHVHSYSAATCTSAKKCACGATSGSALGHNWKNATCTTPKKCSRCGTESGKAAAHTYTKKVTSATCTKKGYTTYTCSACGDSYKDNYVNASHNYKNYKCTSCGAIDKANAYS